MKPIDQIKKHYNQQDCPASFATIILKVVAGVYLAIVLFLFALNGRYESIDGSSHCVDKWKGAIVIPGLEPVKFGKNK
jgi:hypothetical protein